MYQADQYVHMTKHFNKIYKKDPAFLEQNYEKVCECITNRDLSGITTAEAGLAFRFDELGYQEKVIIFLKDYFDGFVRVVRNGSLAVMREDQEHWPNHKEIYKLLFINFSNEEFMRKVQKIVDIAYHFKLLPVINECFDKMIFNDPNLETMIRLIKSQKHDYFIYTKGEEDMTLEDNDKNYEMRELQCDALINKHKAFYNRSKKKLMLLQQFVQANFNRELKVYDLSDEEINSRIPRFLIGPQKEAYRTKEKLNEYSKDLSRNFPWYMLRDITRCSFILKNCKDCVILYDLISKFCIEDLDLTIVEIKNMFEGWQTQTEERRYSYKDIKLILKFDLGGFPIFIEVQLILNNMIELKKSMHKFYEITRAKFSTLSFDYYKELMKIGLDSITYDYGMYYDKEDISNYFEYLVEYCKEIGNTAHELNETSTPVEVISPYSIFRDESLSYCYVSYNGNVYKGFWDDSSQMPSIFVCNSPKVTTYNYSFYLPANVKRYHTIKGQSISISGLNTSIQYFGQNLDVVIRYSFVQGSKYLIIKEVYARSGKVDIVHYYSYLEDNGQITKKNYRQPNWNSYYISRLDFTIYY